MPIQTSFSHHLRTEDKFLLNCMRHFLQQDDLDDGSSTPQPDLDWGDLLRSARKNRIIPHLYRYVKETCPDAPDDVRAQLEYEFNESALDNLALTRELLRLLDLFRAHDIPSIPFKGPQLASSVYGNVSLRQFGDLDILIPIDDVPEATRLLQAEGYQLDYRLTEKQAAYYLKSGHHHHLHNPQTDFTVELHWRISADIYAPSIDLDALWSRAKPADLLGKKVLSLSSEDLLLILCEHGTRHAWGRLSWVGDVAMLLKNQNINWPIVFERTDAAGSERILLLGLLLAHDLLGSVLTPEILKKIQIDPQLRSLEAQAIQAIFAERERDLQDIEGGMNLMLFYQEAANRSDGKDKANLLLKMALYPIADDFQFVPLPDILFPLYYLIRPIRLISVYRTQLLKCIKFSIP